MHPDKTTPGVPACDLSEREHGACDSFGASVSRRTAQAYNMAKLTRQGIRGEFSDHAVDIRQEEEKRTRGKKDKKGKKAEPHTARNKTKTGYR